MKVLESGATANDRPSEGVVPTGTASSKTTSNGRSENGTVFSIAAPACCNRAGSGYQRYMSHAAPRGKPHAGFNCSSTATSFQVQLFKAMKARFPFEQTYP